MAPLVTSKRKNELTADAVQFEHHLPLFMVFFDRGALHTCTGAGDCNRSQVWVEDTHPSDSVSSVSIDQYR